MIHEKCNQTLKKWTYVSINSIYLQFIKALSIGLLLAAALLSSHFLIHSLYNKVILHFVSIFDNIKLYLYLSTMHYN